MSDAWTIDQITDQTGRTAVVTGANNGLGLVTAEHLARAGAKIIMASAISIRPPLRPPKARRRSPERSSRSGSWN